jgi:hypothetical protein
VRQAEQTGEEAGLAIAGWVSRWLTVIAKLGSSVALRERVGACLQELLDHRLALAVLVRDDIKAS